MIKCSNCRCDIDKSKIVLHERFCSQNITYCEKCKEAVIKEEYEEHCLAHNKAPEEEKSKKLDSEEERNNRSLERVMSSKIGCEYCGFLLGYSEIEEHEKMCGARTTQCKVCHQNVLYQNLDNHIKTEHNLNKSVYKEMDSFNNISQYSKNDSYKKELSFKEKLSQSALARMTSDEQIAYALALSEKDNQNNNTIKSNNTEKDNNKTKKDSSKEVLNTSQKKKSNKINYDEIDEEYERQMYEDEMKNFGCDEEKEEKK